MTDFFYAIGHLFQSAFKIIDKFHNFPNKVFFVAVFVALILWLRRQSKYNEEAEQNGTYK